MPRSLPPRIGRCEVIRALAEDSSAEVFLALQRGAFDVTKLVVVKQVHAELAAEPQRLGRLVDAWRCGLRFNHPNLFHTYEVNVEDADCHLVREYLEGHTLEQLLQRVGREHFGLDEYVWILSQVLSGLHYAHELADFDGEPLGIVHGDVRPDNIFITAPGEVKLLGFGGPDPASAPNSPYASPEQRAGRALDPRDDVYSVGLMLWEAIARRPRPVNDSPLAALARLETGEPVAIESVVPDAPPALIGACRLALARNPEQRARSAFELEQLLDEFLSQRGHNRLSRSLARWMRVHFERDFAQLRQAIDVYVNFLPRSSVRQIPELSRASLTPHSRAYGFAHSQAPAKPRPRHEVVLGAGLVAVALGVGVLSLLRRAPEPTPTAGIAAAPLVNRVASTREEPERVPPMQALHTNERGPMPSARPPAEAVPARATMPASRAPAHLSKRASVAVVTTAAPSAAPPATVGTGRSATASELQPGVDLTKARAQHSRRQIDDKDPY